MKTITIKTLKKEVLVIELPKNGYCSLSENRLQIRDYNSCLLANIEGSYTLLGSPDEIKEEDAEELVEETEMGVKLNSKKYKYRSYDSQLGYATATESLLSALEKEILWENPYGKEPFENLQSSTFGGEKTIIHRNQMNILWHEAESRTFDRNRTLIFIKN